MVAVKIVGKAVIKIPITDEETREMARITYKYDGLPPRTIWIDTDKATKENVARMIKADLAKAGVEVGEVELEL